MTSSGTTGHNQGGAFRFRGGALSLDFTATVVGRLRQPEDQLATPSDLARWIAAAGLRPIPRQVSVAAWESARSLREAIFRLMHAHIAGHRPAAADVRLLNAVAAAAPATPQLAPDGTARWLAEAPATAALAAIARDAIMVLTGPAAARLRNCAGDDCALLFIDGSRPGRRRWCAGDACGNRHHIRAFRARQRHGAT